MSRSVVSSVIKHLAGVVICFLESQNHTRLKVVPVDFNSDRVVSICSSLGQAPYRDL